MPIRIGEIASIAAPMRFLGGACDASSDPSGQRHDLIDLFTAAPIMRERHAAKPGRCIFAVRIIGQITFAPESEHQTVHGKKHHFTRHNFGRLPAEALVKFLGAR